jgi:hypothetical protein
MSEIDDILMPHEKKGKTEVRNDLVFSVLHIEGDETQTSAKDCWLVGTFEDLREIGNGKFYIYNLIGELVRIVTFHGNYITIDAMVDEEVIIPASTKIWYEPWFMDRGSYVFEDRSNRVLKLSTEMDKLSPTPITDDNYDNERLS